MLPSSRILAFAAIATMACGHPARGAAADEDALPPEPQNGEWIEDTLEDDSLWFASSGNLAFDAVARELTDYSRGRCWVHVVDGKPAWVMYFVPGEILGFEVDTHHFGAAATEFRFAAGARWDALTAVAADFEEIVAFEAKWLRLYRSVDELPQGTRFLKIEFPADAEVEAARLTEVWLRCRFDEGAAPTTNEQTGSPAVTEVTTEIVATLPVENDVAIEPYVVRAFIYAYQPPPAPEFPPITVDATPPVVTLETPAELGPYDAIGDYVPVVEAPPAPSAPAKPKTLWSRIVTFVRDRVTR